MPWSTLSASESSWALLGCELPCLFPSTGCSQAQDSASYFGWSWHEGNFCMLEFLRMLIYVILAKMRSNFSTILQLLFIHLSIFIHLSSLDKSGRTLKCWLCESMKKDAFVITPEYALNLASLSLSSIENTWPAMPDFLECICKDCALSRTPAV